MPTQTELRQQITERIVQALQQNAIPWRRPVVWTVNNPPRNEIASQKSSGDPRKRLEQPGGQHDRIPSGTPPVGDYLRET